MLCIFAASAQNKNADIKGQVKDIANHSAISASVFLFRYADSSLVKFTIADQNGVFHFDDIKPDTYFINVTLTGYEKVSSKNFVLHPQATLDVGIIQLKNNHNKLNEVVIMGNKSFIETRAGKVILNVQNSILSVGNTALEILKRAPGVQIDNNDNISLNGKSDVLILIDNKPTYLSGTALTDLLQSTQSSMIDKIELISNPNATYDAAGTGGIINIKLKRDKSLGTNVQVYGGTGVSQPGGAYNSKGKVNAGVNFNYRTKNLNVFGGYSYSDAPMDRLSASERLVNYNNQINQIDVNWFNQQQRETNYYRLGADYNITPKHIIGILFNGSVSYLNADKSTLSAISNQNIVDSLISTNSGLKKTLSNYALNLNYKGNLNKWGELTVDADYSNYERSSMELLQSSYFYAGANDPYRYLSLQNTSPSSYNLYVFNVSYELNINAANTFTAGAKTSFIKTDNNSNFGQLVNGVYMAYPMFTDQFKYTENINAANVDYNHIFNKKINLELGLRVEQTISDGVSPTDKQNVKNNYYDIFPNVQLTNNINDDNQLELTYSRRITRPRYEDLNPFLTYIDQYTYQIGTPYLKPFYSNTIELTHTFKNKFTTILSTSVVNGFTQVVYMQDNQTKIITLSKVNLGNRYNYGIQFIEPVTFCSWYNVDFNLNLLYERFTNVSSAGDLDSGSPDITFKLQQHFKLPLNLKAELFGLYETPTTFGIFRYKQNYYFNAGVSKSILNGQGSIQLLADDIFNSDKIIYTSHYQNLNISGNQKNSFRTIQLGFSYAFGSKTIKAVRRRDTGAEDEQGRAGNGIN
jgi:iron complex outermembrane receptor protein